MSQPIVSLTEVSKSYHHIDALNSVTLKVNEGEVMGLFGHNGAGKTTFMKLILGIAIPSSGNVEVMGTQPNAQNLWAGKSKIGFLPEQVNFYEQLSGLAALTYFAKLKGYSSANAKKHALALLEQVGITHAMQRAIKTYSKGMRQRLGLAQALIGEPKLLLLDEPTVGLDPVAIKGFFETIEQLKAKGTSVIICTHVLPDVEQHIDQAVILSSGQLLAQGSLSQLQQEANLPVSINYSGISDIELNEIKLKYAMSHNQKNTLLVPEQEKLAVVKQLLTFEALTDLQLQSAGLDKIYQHYIEKYSASVKDNMTSISTGKQS